MSTAKVFWSGRSQAVRLPKQFRFETDEVRIRRQGRSIVLEPIAKDWTWLERVTGPVDADFETATKERLPDQVRPALDVFE